MNPASPPSFQALMRRDLLASGALAGKRLTVRAHQVLLSYAAHANRDGESWPSAQTIAGYWGVSERTVSRAKTDLVAAGVLADTGRKSGERGSKIYRFEFEPAGQGGVQSAKEPAGQGGVQSAKEPTGQKQVANRTVLATQPDTPLSDKGMKCEDKTLQPAKTAGRQCDPIWDTVAELFFEGKVAKPHRKRAGKIVRDLKDLGATPAEIRIRFTRYRELHPTWTLTPEALVKHWCSLVQDPGVVLHACQPSTADTEDADEVETYGQLIRDMNDDQRAQHGLPLLAECEVAHAG